MFILDFLCIHLFNDENGRMSRLLNLFQESCTVQCNVRGTYNYHSISAERIMPGKTKAKKGDGVVSRILEDANSSYNNHQDERNGHIQAVIPAPISVQAWQTA